MLHRISRYSQKKRDRIRFDWSAISRVQLIISYHLVLIIALLTYKIILAILAMLTPKPRYGQRKRTQKTFNLQDGWKISSLRFLRYW